MLLPAALGDTMLTLCFQGVVGRLLSKVEDNTMLISRFTEYLEMVDVRFYVMSSIRENVSVVMVKSKGVGSTTVQPGEEAHAHCVSGLWLPGKSSNF